MDYIQLMNKAWQLRTQGLITANELTLYNYLLNKCYELNWSKSFHQSTVVMCTILETSRNSLSSRREKLQKTGLIKYTPGKCRMNPPQYQICDMEDRKQMNDSSSSFTAPSLEQVKEYCDSRSSSVDPARFVNYYSSIDWKVGNSTMKNWQAALRGWEHRARNSKPTNPTNHKNTKNYEKF